MQEKNRFGLTLETESEPSLRLLALPCGGPLSHFRFPISDFRFLISNFQFPISNFQFPISDFRFPISDFQFPISNFQFPISNFRFLIRTLTSLDQFYAVHVRTQRFWNHNRTVGLLVILK